MSKHVSVVKNKTLRPRPRSRTELSRLRTPLFDLEDPRDKDLYSKIVYHCNIVYHCIIVFIVPLYYCIIVLYCSIVSLFVLYQCIIVSLFLLYHCIIVLL